MFWPTLIYAVLFVEVALVVLLGLRLFHVVTWPWWTLVTPSVILMAADLYCGLWLLRLILAVRGMH
jgi:hypothetical protein